MISWISFDFSIPSLLSDLYKIPIPETAPLDPVSPYGASKVAGEKLITQYHLSYGQEVRERVFDVLRFVLYFYCRLHSLMSCLIIPSYL